MTGILRRMWWRRRRRLFRTLICAERGPLPPTPNRDDVEPCGGCILPSFNLSAAGESAAPGTSSEMTMSARGGKEVGTHKYEQPLLSFAGSNLPNHLRHVNAERAEAMEDLLAPSLTEGRGLG